MARTDSPTADFPLEWRWKTTSVPLKWTPEDVDLAIGITPGDVPPLLGALSRQWHAAVATGTAVRTSARPAWLWAGRLWADRVPGRDLDEQCGAAADGTVDLERAAERLDAVAEPH